MSQKYVSLDLLMHEILDSRQGNESTCLLEQICGNPFMSVIFDGYGSAINILTPASLVDSLINLNSYQKLE